MVRAAPCAEQETVRRVGDVSTDPETAEPRHSVRVVDCGLNSLKNKYDLAPAQLDSVTDIN